MIEKIEIEWKNYRLGFQSKQWGSIQTRYAKELKMGKMDLWAAKAKKKCGYTCSHYGKK